MSGLLKKHIKALGADLVGFADLTELPSESRQGFDYGISIAKAIDPEIVKSLKTGPNRTYFETYNSINRHLDEMGAKVISYIQEKGYDAHAIIATKSVLNKELCTSLPHKTTATRAGLGWIGKSALLITESFGPAIRFTTVLTNYPLETATPINDSKCGSCQACVSICDAKAIKGVNWNVELPRQAYYDAFACKAEVRKKCDAIDVSAHICGQCIYACPYTQRYIKNELTSR
jgi:epoxyqueuosine reductase QueG